MLPDTQQRSLRMRELIRRPAAWVGAALVVVAIGAVIGIVTGHSPVALGSPSPSSSASQSFVASLPSLTTGSSPTGSATPTTAHTPTVGPTSTSGLPTATSKPTSAATPRATAPTKTPAPPQPGGAAVLVGAGDICNKPDVAGMTANLLATIPGSVFTAGDNAYSGGTPAEFSSCFNPTWGRFKARMFPAPGNHEYDVTSNAAGYFGYFGVRAHGPGGYYVYSLGGWRIYSLNSEIVSAAEVAWLKSDLASHPTACVMAYWHHPRFSSGTHGNDGSVQPFWDALYAARAELIVNGHDHDYERFAPQTPSGASSATGIREIVAGTGGAGLRPFANVVANSQVRNAVTHGVLKLTLRPGGYTWQFVPADGSFTDSGSGSCH